jgi:hypothetical protein
MFCEDYSRCVVTASGKVSFRPQPMCRDVFSFSFVSPMCRDKSVHVASTLLQFASTLLQTASTLLQTASTLLQVASTLLHSADRDAFNNFKFSGSASQSSFLRLGPSVLTSNFLGEASATTPVTDAEGITQIFVPWPPVGASAP